MLQVERRFTGKAVRYFIYTKEEADNLGMEYTYWRDVDETTPINSWVITDDDFVFQVIRIKIRTPDHGKRFKRKTVIFHGTIEGSYFTNRVDPLEFQNLRPQGRRRNKFFEKWSALGATAVAQCIINGGNPLEDINLQVPTTSGHLRNISEALADSNFAFMVEEKIQKHFARKGIDAVWIWEKYLSVYNEADAYRGQSGKKPLEALKVQLAALKSLEAPFMLTVGGKPLNGVQTGQMGDAEYAKLMGQLKEAEFNIIENDRESKDGKDVSLQPTITG